MRKPELVSGSMMNTICTKINNLYLKDLYFWLIQIPSVYFRNVSKPLNKSDSPTYNVALVKAAIEALELVKQYGKVKIRHFYPN